MATNIIPDKWVRKAVFDVVNGIVVSGKTINCYDSRIPDSQNIKEYVLITAQTKDEDKSTKCGYDWNTTHLIEIYTRTSNAGNSGSRLLLNDIEQAVRDLLNPTLTIENFENIKQNITYETQLETVTDTENIFRSFLRLNLTLK